MAEAPPRLIQLDLPTGSKLGVAITPPKHGVTIRGLKIDKVQNELFIGQISHGDLLVEIGGTPLDGMKFADAVNLIKTMPRPLALTFEIVPMSLKKMATSAEVDSLDVNVPSYNVVFDDAKMGLNLDDGARFGIDGAIVKGVRDFAEESGISPGDILYKVNGTEVLFMSLKQVQNLIKATLPPRSLDFIPKTNLEEVQRMNLNMSVVEKNVRVARAKPTAAPTEKAAPTPEKSITEIIQENRSTVIKEGPMYKQGRMVKNWKKRHVVLAVTKLEYFKDAKDKTSQGVVNFENCRCTVRSLPSTSAKLTGAPGDYLLELKAGDREFIMSCTSEEEKMEWLEALKVAIDASKALCRTSSEVDALRSTQLGRSSTRRMPSINEDSSLSLLSRTSRRLSVQGLNLSMQAIPELPSAPSMRIPKDPSMRISSLVAGGPTVDIEVISIQNLTKAFFHVMNPYCEVTLGSETFKTPVVKDSLNPRWAQDNKVVFGVPGDDALIEIRVFDERMIRAAELLSTFTIPIASLPNKTKMEQTYSLILADRSAHASITLSLRYNNDDFEQEETTTPATYGMRDSSLMRAKNQMDLEQAQFDALTNQADQEAAMADSVAKQAQEAANTLVEEARKKAEAAIAAAKKDAMGERAAAEAAIAEARHAQERADAQMAEAKKAQEEAQKLIQRSKLIKQKSFAGGTHLFTNFLRYRAMLYEKTPEAEVKESMLKDGIDEEAANQFLESMRSNHERMAELEREVEQLKRDNSIKRKQIQVAAPPAPRESAADMLKNKGEMSSDQEALLRRLLKLEKQLQQAGIAVADDIPYEEAKKKVEEISRRMGEIGSADVTHPDPKVQKDLREEYFKLEQDMEKYNGALMLTDEYAAEQARKEREWEDENAEANALAVKAIRRMMPVNIKSLSEAQLQNELTPNGKKFTREVALKYKRTDVLQVLRTDPQDLAKAHPSTLDCLRVTGLTVTERRALHMHLRDIAEGWKSQQKEEMAGRKFAWFKSLKDTFKTAANAYNRHVAQYGPPGNHPYATRDEPGVGCPMLGKQCPLKADAAPAYNQDWGYPDGPEFVKTKVLKSAADDAGAQAMAEAAALLKAKAADARAQQRLEGLKAHYSTFKGSLVLVKAANGAIEKMEELVDKIEARQGEWFKRILEKKASNKMEVADFDELINEIRLTTNPMAERSGMNLAGRRNPEKDTPDMRSGLEIQYCILLIDAVLDCFNGVEDRMAKNKFDEEKRLVGAMKAVTDLLKELRDRCSATLSTLSDKALIARKLKSRTELLHEVKEEIRKENEKAAAPPPAAEEAPVRPPNPFGGGGGRGNPLMAAIANRGKKGDDDDGDAPPARPNPFGGGRGGGNPLLAAIQNRGKKGDDDAPPARPANPLMAAIAARGKKGDDDAPPARPANPLMAAIAARGKKGDDDAPPARPANPLMAAIQARGKKGDDDAPPARPANPLMAAIAARGKVGGDDDDAPPARPANPLMAAIAARKKIE